ncbi:MAG: oxidoreductase [Salibacteraceae bacterium]
MKQLENKVILVTGGSGLIGKSIVKDIQSHGGIAINLDINIDPDNDLESHQVFCDITDSSTIKTCFEKIFNHFGRIDGLVNNAYPRTKDWGNKFEDVTPGSWAKNVEMQLNPTFYLSQEVSKYMVSNKKGSIVNISSIYGVVGNDFTVYDGTEMTSPAAYAAIKGGIINFTKYMASYLGKNGVRVNCVSPGGIFDNQNPTFVANFEHRVPLKRMGNPEDIAPAVSFLLSDGANYITGHNLIVDGGWTAI